MAKSTGIVLTATAISFTNEWVNNGTPNFRVGVAGLAVALIFDGIEKINEPAAVGLATIMLISVLLTPINGKSPADTVIDLIGAGNDATKVAGGALPVIHTIKVGEAQ